MFIKLVRLTAKYLWVCYWKLNYLQFVQVIPAMLQYVMCNLFGMCSIKSKIFGYISYFNVILEHKSIPHFIIFTKHVDLIEVLLHKIVISQHDRVNNELIFKYLIESQSFVFIWSLWVVLFNSVVWVYVVETACHHVHVTIFLKYI